MSYNGFYVFLAIIGYFICVCIYGIFAGSKSCKERREDREFRRRMGWRR